MANKLARQGAKVFRGKGGKWRQGSGGITGRESCAGLQVDECYCNSQWAFIVNQSNTAAIAPALHDMALFQRQDVASLKIVDVGDSNALGLASGDGNSTISSVNTLRFYTGGCHLSNPYSGMGGGIALCIGTDKTAKFYCGLCVCGGNLETSGAVVIGGNLTVQGTTTTLDTTNLLVEDPLVVLSKNQSGTPTLDSGLLVERGSSNNVAFIWDESADEFAVTCTSDAGAGAGNINMGGYQNLKASSLCATSSVRIGDAVNLSQANGTGTRLLICGTGDNSMYVGPNNDDSWGYIYSTNNSAGIYFGLNQGNFQFDTGHLGSYTDQEVDIGYPSHQFRCGSFSCNIYGKVICGTGCVKSAALYSTNWVYAAGYLQTPIIYPVNTSSCICVNTGCSSNWALAMVFKPEGCVHTNTTCNWGGLRSGNLSLGYGASYNTLCNVVSGQQLHLRTTGSANIKIGDSGTTCTFICNCVQSPIVCATADVKIGQTLRFTQNHPYLCTGGSHIIVPSGIHVSGGTLYAENTIMSRNGICDDTGTPLTLFGGNNAERCTVLCGKTFSCTCLSTPIVCATSCVQTPYYRRANHHTGHLRGHHDQATNAAKSNPIYTIGAGYDPVDAGLSNMYGIGFTTTSASFISGINSDGNWGMYVAADGDARIWLEASNGRGIACQCWKAPVICATTCVGLGSSTYINGIIRFGTAACSHQNAGAGATYGTGDPTYGIGWGCQELDHYGIIVEPAQTIYSGSYTKLAIGWHTGLKLGAYKGYGGTQFYANSPRYAGGTNPDSQCMLMSVGCGDYNVRVNQNLYGCGCIQSPIVCGTSYMNSGKFCSGSTFMCSNCICVAGTIRSANCVCAAQCLIAQVNVCAVGGVYSPIICGTTAVRAPATCSTEMCAIGGWHRNTASGTGLYNSNRDAHFYAASDNYWHINPKQNQTTGALIFYQQHNSTGNSATGRRGYVYFDGTNNFGLLSCGGNWAVKIGGDTIIHLCKPTCVVGALTGSSSICATTLLCAPTVCGSGTSGYTLRTAGCIYANSHIVAAGEVIATGTVCSTTCVKTPVFCATNYIGFNKLCALGEASGAVNAQPRGDVVKSMQGRFNYASSSCWRVCCTSNNSQCDTGTGGAFSANGDCNRTCLDWDPWGRRSLVWNSYQNDSESGADGGWNKNICCLDPRRSYMSVVYMKRVAGSNGSYYHGAGSGANMTNNLNDTANTNPYFMSESINAYSQGDWYVSVGIIQSCCDPNTSTHYASGVWRLCDGCKHRGNTVYKMGSSGCQTSRVYLYYSDGGDEIVQWWGPGFYEINGGEPSIGELLGGHPVGALVGSNDSNLLKIRKVYAMDCLCGTNSMLCGTTCIHVDADSKLRFCNVGTNAISMYAESGDELYLGSNNGANGTVRLPSAGGLEASSGVIKGPIVCATTCVYAGTVCSTQIYSDNWFRNNTSGTGLYNQATTQHFYSDHDDWWNIAGGTVCNGLRFRDEHAGTIRGSIWTNNSNQLLLSDSGGAVRVLVNTSTDIRLCNTTCVYGTLFGNGHICSALMCTSGGGYSLRTAGCIYAAGQVRGEASVYSNNHVCAPYLCGSSYVCSAGKVYAPCLCGACVYVTGVLRRTAHHTGHFEGGYNNVGESSCKSSPIYTIGSSYNPVDAALSNMYGIGYAHTNASFITGALSHGGWGMYVAADGDARIWLEASSGVGAACSCWIAPVICGTTAVRGTHCGNGAGLTSLNASNLSTGTVATARLPAAALCTGNVRTDTASGFTTAAIQTFCSASNIAVTSGSQSSLQVYHNGTGTDAFMTFHVGGDFALYFGLDGGTNKLSVGGWSMGAASYEIYHAGNKPSLCTLGYTGATNANYITNNNQLTNGAGYTNNTVANAALPKAGGTMTGDIQMNKAIHFQTGSSGNAAHGYAIFQEAGAWSCPYPDLRIAYHTGIKIGAHSTYGGTRFYQNSDMCTLLMSVGCGDAHVRVIGGNFYSCNLICSPTICATGASGYTLRTAGCIYSNSNIVAASGIYASGVMQWSGGCSANANTAYTHSQAAHAPSNATTCTGTIVNSQACMRINGCLLFDHNHGHGAYGLYNSAKYQHVWSMGTSYKMCADGTGLGNLYGLAYTHTNVGGQSKAGLSHQLLFVHAGSTHSAVGTGMWTCGVICAAGTSGYTLRTAGCIYANSHITTAANVYATGDICASALVKGNQICTPNHVYTGSNNNTTTVPSRFYASQDGYIRYYDRNHFKNHLGLTGKWNCSRSQSTSDQNYWVGSMGWGATCFNTAFTWGSGFVDIWGNPGQQPSGTTHWQVVQSLHYACTTTGTAGTYGFQLTVGAGSPALMYIRGAWGGSPSSWYKVWNAANDGAGSGLDADLLDGQQGSYYYAASNPSGYTTCTGTSTLALGSSSSTAHRGDHGVIAYNHSQCAHAPSNANYINNTNQLTNGAGFTTCTGNVVQGQSNITAQDIYATSWLRVCSSGNGMYNQSTGQHWYSDDDDWWNVAGGTANNGIRFRDEHAGTIRGAVYADNSNSVGFLDSGHSWAYKIVNDSSHYWSSNGNTVRMHLNNSNCLCVCGGVSAPIICATTCIDANVVYVCGSGYTGALTCSKSYFNTLGGVPGFLGGDTKHEMRVMNSAGSIDTGYVRFTTDSSANFGISVATCSTTTHRLTIDTSGVVCACNTLRAPAVCATACIMLSSGSNHAKICNSVGFVVMDSTEGLLVRDNSANVFSARGTGNCSLVNFKACCNVYVCGSLSKYTGCFSIPHPDPAKNSTHNLQHSFVESPTEGDNIYRWQVDTSNCSSVITLPSYYKYLNKNDMVWVSPYKSFGAAYGEVTEDQCCLIVCSNQDGCYNVLLIGTRKDENAESMWTGAEVLKPEDEGAPTGVPVPVHGSQITS